MTFKSISLLLFLSLFYTSCAHIGFLNSDDIIGPYPMVGSVEEKQDIDQLLYYQKTRTPKQCEAAALEANSSLETFYGSLLNQEEIARVKKKLGWIKVKTGVKILINKIRFGRPRPYTNHPEIQPCIEKEFSKAYPSGHTTLSRVYARLLGVIFPERSVQFLQRADEIALHRVIGGVHHPSDIAAGKKLADSLVDGYLKDENFHLELEKLRTPAPTL